MRPFHDFGAAWKCSFFTVNHFGISVASTIRNSVERPEKRAKQTIEVAN
jgi:hypothetical protein